MEVGKYSCYLKTRILGPVVSCCRMKLACLISAQIYHHNSLECRYHQPPSGKPQMRKPKMNKIVQGPPTLVKVICKQGFSSLTCRVLQPKMSGTLDMQANKFQIALKSIDNKEG